MEADQLSIAEYEVSLAGLAADERARLVSAKKEEVRLERELRGLNPLDAADIKAKGNELAARREALVGAARDAQITNHILDNSREAIQRSVTENLAAAKKLLDSGKLSSDEYLAFQKEQFERLKKFQNEYEKAWTEIATGTQDILQTYLFDAMQGQFDNLGDMFKKMLDRMVAQALASKLTESLFGMGGTTGGGWVGAAGSFLKGLFREGGGDVNAGQAYVVGEKRPELFVPRVSGTIVPSTAGLGGGTSIQVNLTAIDTKDFMGKMAEVKREVSALVNHTNRAYGLRGA